MSRQFKFETPKIVMIPTTDDWYPNYENNTVKLSYIGKLNDGKFRVCVWGADDLGMDCDFSNKGDAKHIFNKLKDKKNITQKELSDLGFTWS